MLGKMKRLVEKMERQVEKKESRAAFTHMMC